MTEHRFAFERSREFKAVERPKLGLIVEKFRLWDPVRRPTYPPTLLKGTAWYEEGPFATLKTLWSGLVTIWNLEVLLVNRGVGFRVDLGDVQDLLGGDLYGAKIAEPGRREEKQAPRPESNRLTLLVGADGRSAELRLPALQLESANVQLASSTLQSGRLTLTGVELRAGFDSDKLNQPTQVSAKMESLVAEDLLLARTGSMITVTRLVVNALRLAAGTVDTIAPSVARERSIAIPFPLLVPPLVALFMLLALPIYLYRKIASLFSEGLETSKLSVKDGVIDVEELNVVRATHGETRKELLGSGDGGQALQSFTLKQPPLTFTSAPTAVGAESTLAVYVDDVRWHETPSLAWLGPDDRGFATETDDEDKTTVIFGDGEHGARLPTGVQNVRAVYRSGIGRGGDVQAGQINLLQARPLGVAAVVNPLPASGGADRESRDLARENAPLSVMPLDRLVSVQDYADFTRRFAGIAKAVAVATTDGRREVVQLTVAGVDDAPIERTSDLYRNLLAALRELGDPALPVQLDARELKLLALSARIRLQPDRLWEPVVADVRATLLDGFGFAARELGQPARLAEVIATIQGVSGVAHVDLDAFGGIPEKVEDGTRRLTPCPRSPAWHGRPPARIPTRSDSRLSGDTSCRTSPPGAAASTVACCARPSSPFSPRRFPTPSS